MPAFGGISARALAFALPFVVVLAQGIFIATGRREPYPALTMPDFTGTRTAPDGSVAVDTIELTAHFDAGPAADIALHRLLAPMPRLTMMPASQIALRDLRRASDDMRRWLRARLETLHPGRRATGLDARWYRDTYRVEDGELRRIARTPLRASQIDLTP